MRPLAEYGLVDWWRLRPLLHYLKSRRYRRITEDYVSRPARGGDLAAAHAAIHGRNALVSVAFNDDEAIDWQSRLIARFVPGTYVVADNSSDDAAAARIAAVCAFHGVPYVRLPASDWERGVSSRSHGLALNWTWRNLIRPAEPAAFGFLDDDLYPLAPEDPFGLLGGQPCYGVFIERGKRWFLWAGYCFFRFAAVRDLPLDFGQDWFKGLDTGGGNWEVLYRRLGSPPPSLPILRWRAYRDNVEEPEAMLQAFGNWIHEVGTGGDVDLAREKHAAVTEMLDPLLAGCGPSARA